MLHLDRRVQDGVLYRSCSDYNDDSITPSVNINEIDYEQTRFVDVKLFEGCFENSDFVNILKKCLTVDFDRSDTSIEWERYREYRTIHVNNVRPLYHLFESDEYHEFKEILNNEKDLLIDRIILEVHSCYPPSVPGTSSANLQIKIPKSFMVETFPDFPVIQFVVNDGNKTDLVDKEIIKKTFINYQYVRDSIESNVISSERGL
jgi:hypothetical protein